MHRLGTFLLLLGALGCGRGPGPHGHAKDLDGFLAARAQELLPALDQLSGAGGGGGSDGDYCSEFDRRLETEGPIAAEAHAALLGKLATDTDAWLGKRGLTVRARGTTVGEDGSLDRFLYRYEGDHVVGWVAADGIRNDKGGFTLLLTVAEHVD